MNHIAFDLEGSLTTQDNAFELMSSFRNGARLFSILSHYDNMLTMEGKAGHEPGDTLAFIIPFLLLHKVRPSHIESLAFSAEFTKGIENLLDKLNSKGYELFCISAAYEQFAQRIGERLSFKHENIASTKMPLGDMAHSLCSTDIDILKELEHELLQLDNKHQDMQIKKRLDSFFFNTLPLAKMGKTASTVRPIGGRRKMKALKKFAERENTPFSQWIVMGDSITDFRMLNEVNKSGGLAIAYNANQYAIPYCTMSIASTDISSIYNICINWTEGGRKQVMEFVKAKELEGGNGNTDHFHWLLDKSDKSEVQEIHKRIRGLVRKDAGRLG